LFIWNQKLVFIENTEKELKNKTAKIPPKDLFKNQGFIIFVGETGVIRIGAISIPYMPSKTESEGITVKTDVCFDFIDNTTGNQMLYTVNDVIIDTGCPMGLALTVDHAGIIMELSQPKPCYFAGATKGDIVKGVQGTIFVRVGDVTKQVEVIGPTKMNLLGMDFLRQCLLVMDGINKIMIISG